MSSVVVWTKSSHKVQIFWRIRVESSPMISLRTSFRYIFTGERPDCRYIYKVCCNPKGRGSDPKRLTHSEDTIPQSCRTFCSTNFPVKLIQLEGRNISWDFIQYFVLKSICYLEIFKPIDISSRRWRSRNCSTSLQGKKRVYASKKWQNVSGTRAFLMFYLSFVVALQQV